MGLHEADFEWATRAVVAIAEAPGAACQGRVVSVLEGGYSTLPEKDALAKCVAAHVHALRTHPALDSLGLPPPLVVKAAKRKGGGSSAARGAQRVGAGVGAGTSASGVAGEACALGQYYGEHSTFGDASSGDEEGGVDDEESMTRLFKRTEAMLDVERRAIFSKMRLELREEAVALANRGALWKPRDSGLVVHTPKKGRMTRGVPVPVRLLRDALKAYVNVVRQRDLATLFGVSQPLLSLWLNGRRNSAAVKALQRKLQHWIFHGPGAMPVVPPPPSEGAVQI